MKLNSIRATLAVIALLVVAFWSLTLGVFHGWASDVPPYLGRSAHLIWYWLFLLIGLGCLGVAGRMTWGRRAGIKRWFESLIGSEQGR